MGKPWMCRVAFWFFMTLTIASLSVYFGYGLESIEYGDPSDKPAWTNALLPITILGGLVTFATEVGLIMDRFNNDTTKTSRPGGVMWGLRGITMVAALVGWLLLLVSAFVPTVMLKYVGIGLLGWLAIFEIGDRCYHNNRAENHVRNDVPPPVASGGVTIEGGFYVPEHILTDLRNRRHDPSIPTTCQVRTMLAKLNPDLKLDPLKETNVRENIDVTDRLAREMLGTNPKCLKFYQYWFKWRRDQYRIKYYVRPLSTNFRRRLCHRPITVLESKVRHLEQAPRPEELSLSRRHGS